MITPGQPSPTVTLPVFGAGISARQPSDRLAGQMIVGGDVSVLRVMVWVQVAVLPHASVARYVLVVVSLQFTVFTISLTKLTVIVPGQSSDTVTDATFGPGTVALHDNSTLAGQVMRGGVASIFLVIVCVQVAVLPHASVARYVLVVVSRQFTVFTISLTKFTVTTPGQSSDTVTDATFGPGTVALHDNSTLAGQVMRGGTISSFHLTVLDAVDVLLQSSFAVNVLI